MFPLRSGNNSAYSSKAEKKYNLDIDILAHVHYQELMTKIYY